MTFEFDKILDRHERIIWSGKPKFWPFVAQGLPAAIFGLFWLVMTVPMSIMFLAGPFLAQEMTPAGSEFHINGQEMAREEFASNPFFSFTSIFLVLFFIPFYAVGLGMFLSPVWVALGYKKEAYALTDKRVLISKGVIGTDFKILDYDRIKNIEVNISPIDKLFATGTILIFSGEIIQHKNSTSRGKDKLVGIINPYEVFKQLKEVSHDIKTDIEYPNKLRPDENPGYKTEYRL